MGVSQVETTVRQDDLQALKDVVKKVFEFKPAAKGGGRKQVKHRRAASVKKGSAESR